MADKPKKKKRVEVKMKISLSRIVISLLIFFMLGTFLIGFLQSQVNEAQIELSVALNDIRDGKVQSVLVQEENLVLTYIEGGEMKLTSKEKNISFPELLDRAGLEPTVVTYSIDTQSIARAAGEILSIVLPLGLMAAFFFFIIKAQSKGAQDIFSFGKSKAKVFSKGKQDVSFDDVAGVDYAKKELEEIVDFLKSPAKYRRIGARTPRGALLVGPAGVGKTLLARALAGEANVPFFSKAGSEFMEMLVGVGASRVRDLFKQAKAQAPSIIFIDEIDAIGRQRGRGIMGGHDEREQTLNQILVEMDGFTPNDKVIVIAATNRGDLLDPALLRPGRFDRRVVLDLPDKVGREAILKIHAKGKKFVKGIKWGVVADRTVGFSGADLENMLNEAAIFAARNDKKSINMADVEEAATKVKLGPAKKRLQSENDKKLTAYHEGGHGVVSHFLSKTDPVQRISIVARGLSLGHTLIPPAADRTHDTRGTLLQQITAVLGGRAAEQVVFDEMTSGASNDIVQATRIARAMVVDFGMSDLGPINLGKQSNDITGSSNWFEQNDVSPATAEKVDLEVKRIIDGAYEKALLIIKRERKILDKVVKSLLEKETLDRDAFEKIVGKKLLVQ